MPTHGDIRQGFVYQRLPHITLKSIANDAEIDVIWERFQETLEPLRDQLNTALGEGWAEWEIPRQAGDAWAEAARALHAEWWDARIARQRQIDASIAAKADSGGSAPCRCDDRSIRRADSGPATSATAVGAG